MARLVSLQSIDIAYQPGKESKNILQTKICIESPFFFGQLHRIHWQQVFLSFKSSSIPAAATLFPYSHLILCAARR